MSLFDSRQPACLSPKFISYGGRNMGRRNEPNEIIEAETRFLTEAKNENWLAFLRRKNRQRDHEKHREARQHEKKVAVECSAMRAVSPVSRHSQIMRKIGIREVTR